MIYGYRFAFAKTKNDKTFITPKRFVKGTSYGYAVDALSNQNKAEFLIEIDNEIH